MEEKKEEPPDSEEDELFVVRTRLRRSARGLKKKK
jgi:hypothetical protein